MMRRVYALVVRAVLIGAVMVALHAGDSSATTVPFVLDANGYTLEMNTDSSTVVLDLDSTSEGVLGRKILAYR